MKFSIIETKTVPTIQVLFNNKKMVLHSKYDPLKEATIWVEKEIKQLSNNSSVLVIGLGAGYHIEKLSKTLPSTKIIVLEFNEQLFNWVKLSPFYVSLKKLQNVEVKLGSSLSTKEKEMLFSNINAENILIHKSGLDLLPKEFLGIKATLEDLKMQKSSLQVHEPHLNQNLQQNILLKNEGIGKWRDKFEGRPMILVSAGPSLDKQLPLLKKIYDEGYFIIGSVGTAVKSLLNADIKPHFFSIIDPGPGTLTQIKDISLSTTPLFYLSTAYYETIKLHDGPKYIFYQHSSKPEQLENHPLISTGGSVANALFDLMVYFGGKTIALIGQDLAFTYQKTHAQSTESKRNITLHENTKFTLDYTQKKQVPTAANLLYYKKWFENYAKRHPSLTLLNCTEGGAYIDNWKHIPFRDFYEKYKNK